MSTFEERVAWVLEHRKDRIKSMRQWGLSAGLGPGTISAIIARGGGMNADTLFPLAEVAGVPPEWLRIGAGDPDAAAQVLTFPDGRDPYPSRRIAARRAQENGALPEVIARISTSPTYNTHEHSTWKARRWGDLFMVETIKTLRGNAPELQRRVREKNRQTEEARAIAAEEKAATERAARQAAERAPKPSRGTG